MTSIEYLPCPICYEGKEKPRYREEGLRYHLREFHKRVDVDELVKLAREIASEEGHSSKKLSRDDVEVYVSLPPYKATIWVENKETEETIWKLEGAENINRFGWKDQSRDQLEERVLKHLEDIGKLVVDVEKIGHSSKKLSRDDVRVEVWEERDRLHIGIQNKETGDYLKSWWDDDAREMFEQGFFKSGPRLKESVLEYAEDMGILER